MLDKNLKNEIIEFAKLQEYFYANKIGEHTIRSIANAFEVSEYFVSKLLKKNNIVLLPLDELFDKHRKPELLKSFRKKIKQKKYKSIKQIINDLVDEFNSNDGYIRKKLKQAGYDLYRLNVEIKRKYNEARYKK